MDIKNSLRSLTIFLSLLLLVFTSVVVAEENTRKIDKLFVPWDKPDSPGCALAIIKDGQIIHKKGYGMANLEHNIPLTPGSAFYIGSVSKQFVTMCIALLAKQGKLCLDDDIRQHVPELPDYGTPITIKHLIYHTSGLRDYLELLDIAGVDFGTYHQEDVLDLIARQKELNFKPGEMHLYSNSGYFLLAIIVERASGKTLREFARENIFLPLGMKNSHFHDEYTRIIRNRASGYYPAGEGKYKNFISTFDCVGSGGLFTTVEDLFLWDQNFYHAQVGGRDLIDTMHKTGRLSNGNSLDYAFALHISQYRGLKTVGHGGSLGGYKSAFLRFPEQKFSVICLSNLSSFVPMRLCQQVADIYLVDQFIAEKVQKETKIEEKPETYKAMKGLTLSVSELRHYQGDFYSDELQMIFRLTVKEGQLYFTHRNAPKKPLHPTLHDRFTVRSLKIQFIRDRQNKISGFKIDTKRVKNLRFDKISS